MSNVLISEDTMRDIADSIRLKTLKQELLKPVQMPAEIESITGGGGSPVADPDKDVRFIDYDGTVVYSYTLAELQGLEQLPIPPVHEGLVSQGWNWTLQGLKQQNSMMKTINMHIHQTQQI